MPPPLSPACSLLQSGGRLLAPCCTSDEWKPGCARVCPGWHDIRFTRKQHTTGAFWPTLTSAELLGVKVIWGCNCRCRFIYTSHHLLLCSLPHKSAQVFLATYLFPRFRTQVVNTEEVLEPSKKSQWGVKYTIVNIPSTAFKCEV